MNPEITAHPAVVLPRDSDRSRTRRIVVAGVAVALAIGLRLILAYALRDSFDMRGNRSSGVLQVAQVLAQSGEFSVRPGQPTAVNEPLYTALVAVIFRTLGESWFAVALAQALLCVVNAGLVYKLTQLLFGDRRAAAAAATGVAFYPFYVTQAVSISETSLYCSLVALSTYLVALGALRSRNSYLVLAGVAWGLTILTRQSGIGLMAPAVAFLFLHAGVRRAAIGALIVVSVAAATLAPWALRNYRLTGKILLSSHGAIELWFAYNDRTASVLASDVTVDVMRRDQDARIPALEELDQRRFATPIQREVAESEIFLSEAIGYVRAHPAASVRMMPLKLWKFWSWFKTPRTNALNPTAPTSRFASAWDALYTATYTPILLLSLAGLYLARGHWRRHGLLLLLFAGYSALHTLVYGFTRLRVPIDQFLIVYAAFAVVALAAAGRPAAEARPIVTA